MPDTTLDQAIKEAYASAPASDVILHTLEIRHATFATPIRVVRDRSDLTATLEASAPIDPSTAVLFTAFAFDIVPPEVHVSGSPQCVIEIDNVSREILAYIEQAMSSTELLECTYRAYLASDLTGPQNDPPLTLTIISVAADMMKIRAVATFGDISNRKFPAIEYSAEVFPGLIAQ